MTTVPWVRDGRSRACSSARRRDLPARLTPHATERTRRRDSGVGRRGRCTRRAVWDVAWRGLLRAARLNGPEAVAGSLCGLADSYSRSRTGRAVVLKCVECPGFRGQTSSRSWGVGSTRATCSVPASEHSALPYATTARGCTAQLLTLSAALAPPGRSRAQAGTGRRPGNPDGYGADGALPGLPFRRRSPAHDHPERRRQSAVTRAPG